MGEFEFDVFLCHNSQDKPTVIEIANQLKAKTIKPWLDDWELQPGLPWQPELQRQIQNIKSAAVFIGQNGIGPWQQREIESFLQEFDQRKCPVIPVLLPQAPQKEPELPLFLKSMTWVDFREGSSVYTDPLEKLVWGITGIKPVSQSIIQHKAIKRHNYSNLEELLNARNWGEADNVTFTIICTILDVEKKQPLYIKDIKNFLCTEEVIMKVAHDINKDIMLPFTFGAYQTNEHDQYHFELWNETFNKPKPLYMVWHDIINY